MINKRISKKILRIVSFVLVFTMVFTSVIPANVAMAAGNSESEYEWYNFRNNQENNGVTDRETPRVLEETTLKWAQKYGTGWSAAPTPPVIVKGKIYIAVSDVVLEIEKETGEVLRQSTPMVAKAGYAMNPPLYADGKIFVQVGNGMIQAVDVETMEAVWHTEKIGGQTVSPISYTEIDGKGYVYLGTWTGESKDGSLICATTDNSNVIDGVKVLTWKFTPSGDTTDVTVKYDQKLKDTLSEEDNVAHRGFYWAGAYVNEKYLAIGSDDGTKEGDYSANAVFYTINPKTGDIIDRIDNIKGDIRTTVVYDNGYLYFSTKGGQCYKVAVDKDGNLGTVSYIDLGGMTTASPVVYGNKIYIGVAGQGGQFDADGGHGFAVIDNSKPELSDESLMYKIPIKGYPQASALVSTAYADEDFDGNGKPDGRVYIYFTYNAMPGGIYYTYDTADQTEVAENSTELFVPSTDKQQFCISTICADAEGTLYYKNDSCYLMAVEKNYAYLENLNIKTDNNTEVTWDQDFSSSVNQYNIVVKNTVKSITVDALPVDGADSLYYDDKEINMENAAAASTSVIVEKNGKTRTYKLNIRKEGTDSVLSELYVSNSNTYGSSKLTMTEEFNYDVFEYSQDISSLSKSFYNVWPTAADVNATVKVFAGENVADSKGNAIAQGTEIAYTSISNNHSRYAIYQQDKTKTSSVNIQVTSEDGDKTSEYTLKLVKKYYFDSVTTADGDYTGSEVNPPINVTNGLGENLIEGTDYTVSFSNNINIGTAEAVVTGKGKYSGLEKTVNFEICQPVIKSVETEDQIYTGNEITPEFKVISASGNVVPASEYVMTYENNTEIGIAKVFVTAAEGSAYTGTANNTFEIRKTNVEEVVLKNGDLYAYTGSEVKPAISVYDENGKTISSSSYTVTYTDNIEVGKGKVIATAKDTAKYQGKAQVEFDILNGEITSYKVKAQPYTGDPVFAEVTVLDNNRKVVPKSAYTIEFRKNTDIGMAEFTVTAREKSGYFGEIVGTFEIEKARIARVEVADQKYTKEAVKPSVEVYDNYGKKVAAKNYTVTYTDNIEVGQAGVVVKAKENSVYRGSLYSNFFITKTKAVSAAVKNEKVSYTGSTVKNSVVVKDEFGNTIPSSDYTLSFSSNINPGKAKVTVSMKNDSIYSGIVKTEFVIVPKAATNTKAQLYGYDDVKVTWTKSKGASGYDVYYKKDSSNSYTYYSSTTVTSMKIANLTDGIKYNFKVVPYYSSDGTKYSSLQSSVSSAYTLKKVSTPTVTTNGTKVKVKWSNISGETGYQISKSTTKAGTNIVSTYATTSGTYKNVSAKKGKTYYYKVRAFKTVNSTKIFAPWSDVKAYKR